MPADDCLWAENCNRAEDGREPTIEPNEQRSVLLSCGRFDTCRRSTLSCWRRTRISATSFVLGLKSEAMIWRISRRNSIIKWQGYRVSASRLAESNFRYTQGIGKAVLRLTTSAARPRPATAFLVERRGSIEAAQARGEMAMTDQRTRAALNNVTDHLRQRD